MESGTVETKVETNGSNGAPAAEAETLEVLNPATGETIATLPVDAPEAVAATVARVRAAQPDWEAMGIEGRYHWLGKLRDWILDNQDRVLDTMQRETGKVRADASNEPDLPGRHDQLLRHPGGQVHRRGKRPPPLPPAGGEEARASSTGPIRWSASSAPGTSR